MEREALKKTLNERIESEDFSELITADKFRIYNLNYQNYGNYICLEEFSELREAITRLIRGRITEPNDISIEEEFADVLISLEYLYGIYYYGKNATEDEILNKLLMDNYAIRSNRAESSIKNKDGSEFIDSIFELTNTNWVDCDLSPLFKTLNQLERTVIQIGFSTDFADVMNMPTWKKYLICKNIEKAYFIIQTYATYIFNITYEHIFHIKEIKRHRLADRYGIMLRD